MIEINPEYAYSNRGSYCEHCSHQLPHVIRFCFDGGKVHFICESCLHALLSAASEPMPWEEHESESVTRSGGW